MPVNPLLPVIDYTSRDYEAIRADLIRLVRQRLPQWTAEDPNDFGVALVEAVAYTADQLHYYLDRVVNEAYLSTAMQRESVMSIATLLGYKPYEAVPSYVTLEFTNASSGPVVVPALSRCQAVIEQTDGSTVRSFETLNDLVVGGNTTAITVAVQGRTYTAEQAGVSSGLAFQRFYLPRTSILRSTIVVTTVLGENSTDWTQVDTLDNASDDDQVFVAERQYDGSVSIIFGDGINGEIPPLHALVVVTYRVGGGMADVPAHSVNALVDPIIPNITVTNPNAATGGQDDESLNSIRVNASRSFRARDRAVTTYDYMALAKSYGSVSKAKVVSTNGSSVVAFVCAQDDGSGRPTLTPDQEENIRVYLTSVSMAGVDVTVVDALWVPIHLDLTVHCTPTAKRVNVDATVRQILDSLFAFENMDFNARLTIGDVLTALFGATGVSYGVVNGIGTSPTTLSLDPIFFDDIAVNAVPYWYEPNLTLSLVGGL